MGIGGLPVYVKEGVSTQEQSRKTEWLNGYITDSLRLSLADWQDTLPDQLRIRMPGGEYYDPAGE